MVGEVRGYLGLTAERAMEYGVAVTIVFTGYNEVEVIVKRKQR